MRVGETRRVSDGYEFQFEQGTEDARATVSARDGHCTIYLTVNGETFGASIRNLPTAKTNTWIQVKGPLYEEGAHMAVCVGETPLTEDSGFKILALIKISHGDEDASESDSSSDEDQEKFDIFVRYYGTELNRYTVSSNMLVKELKLMIQERKRATPKEQRLQYRSRPLEDSQTLGFYDIGPNATFECLGRLLGGLSK